MGSKNGVTGLCQLLLATGRRGLSHTFLPVGIALMFASWSIGQEATGQSRSREAPATQQTKEIFSGPQVGEDLLELPVWIKSLDDKPSEKADLAEIAKKHPTTIIFMHEKSRPAFGLARLVSEFARKKTDKEIKVFLVVLTDDRSSTETWLGMIHRYFEPPTRLAVADGGIEGPGSLGLNRLVAVTALVVKDGKVTKNMALTQVTEAVDAPALLEAMNEVSGGGEIPSLDELRPRPRR
ncbi:MAG: hypothetical protein KDB03_02920 [Planctomycetales bacterium]|nr:hypothetical protein [Planctomycetales bacterium]